MIKLSKEQLAALRITRFVFHVVHHGESEPFFLDEIDVGEFEPFFLERVKSILKGTAFEFNPRQGFVPFWRRFRMILLSFGAVEAVGCRFHAHGLDDKRIRRGL